MAKVKNSIRIRRIYDKMMIAASLAPKTAGVGLSQEFDGGIYSPDHSATPLVLSPVISASAADIPVAADWTVGETEATAGNANLAWRVNGAAINTVWAEGTDYEFNDNGKELWIKRNIAPSETFSVTCKVLILDSRTGIAVPFTSETATLATVSVTEAAAFLRLSRNNVVYDDMADDLSEWQYRNARGLPQAMNQLAAANDACHKKYVDIAFTRGSAGRQTSGFGLAVKDSAGNVAASIGAADSSAAIYDSLRINSLTRTTLEIDCRTILSERFTVIALDQSGAEIPTARDTVEVTRKHRDFDSPEIVNNSDYTARDAKYYNAVRISVNGEELEYPESCLAIDYFTKANQAGAAEKYVGSGNYCHFNPNDAGDGLTPSDNGFDMTVEVDYHEIPAQAMDDNGTDHLTDEDGNILLI